MSRYPAKARPNNALAGIDARLTHARTGPFASFRNW